MKTKDKHLRGRPRWIIRWRSGGELDRRAVDATELALPFETPERMADRSLGQTLDPQLLHDPSLDGAEVTSSDDPLSVNST